MDRIRLLHKLTKKNTLTHLTSMATVSQFNLTKQERKRAKDYIARDVGKLVGRKVRSLLA